MPAFPVNSENRLQNPATILLSVCICTYNGAARIPAVIECLVQQTISPEAWELLIIDNASKDGTTQIANDLLKHHVLLGGRVVLEPQPGVPFARRRAALEAQGEIVCFLDDDNLPDPDYLETALRIFQEHPRTGSVGGKISAEWEFTPTPLARAVEAYALAIVDRGDEPFIYSWVAEGPVGAGMCIRRELLRQAFYDSELCRAVPSRIGDSLNSGEDQALAVKVLQAGYERRYDPALQMRHRLNGQRMNRSYLLRLYHGIGRGQIAVRSLWAPDRNRRSVVFLLILKNLWVWLHGAIARPARRKWLSEVPADIRSQSSEIMRDLHALEQSLVWGRVVEAWGCVFAKPSRDV